MPPEQLAWQPDAQANSIGVTVWHLARWLDVLATIAIDGCDAGQELWFTWGWAEKTKCDPRGIGTNGLGGVTGYTQAQVKAIPAFSGEDSRTYYDEVSTALKPKLALVSPNYFARPMTNFGSGGVLSRY